MSDDPENDKLLYELINQRQNQEWQRVNDLDSKANNLIGFIVTITALLLSIVGFNPSFFRSELLVERVIFLSGIALLLIALFSSLWAFRIQSWKLVPDGDSLIRAYSTSSVDWTLGRVCATMADATEVMRKQNNCKARDIRLSWFWAVSGLFAMFIYAVAVIFSA